MPALATVLKTDALPAQEAADWAKLDYLQRQVGWEGIGQIVQQLGRGQSLDDTLNETLGMNASAFEEVWLADWRGRIRQTTADLDALLLARQSAVVGGDKEAFIRTIATGDPAIFADELAWWEQVRAQGVANIVFEGRPLVFLDNGGLLAEIESSYRPNGPQASTHSATFTTLLKTAAQDESVIRRSGYRWAGPQSATLTGEQVVIHYPPGQEEMAEQALAEVENTLSALATDLGLVRDRSVANPLVGGQPISIRLHGSESDLRAGHLSHCQDG